MLNIYRTTTLFSVMLFASTVFANDVENTTTQNTISRNTTIETSHSSTAKDWNLTDTEWKHYIDLMQGPSGHYYQKLSPAEVLGIQAETAEELRHYAEIAAKFEHDKLEHELRFNAAFHDAAAKLYAVEPIVRPFDMTRFTPIPSKS